MDNKECCCYCCRRETCVGFGWLDRSCKYDKESCSIRKRNCKDNTNEVIEDAGESE